MKTSIHLPDDIYAELRERGAVMSTIAREACEDWLIVEQHVGHEPLTAAQAIRMIERGAARLRELATLAAASPSAAVSPAGTCQPAGDGSADRTPRSATPAPLSVPARTLRGGADRGGGVLPDCARCGHSPDWHRHDDADNHDITDPDCPFRCIGYDCEAPGPPPPSGRACDCPDYVPGGAVPHDR